MVLLNDYQMVLNKYQSGNVPAPKWYYTGTKVVFFMTNYCYKPEMCKENVFSTRHKHFRYEHKKIINILRIIIIIVNLRISNVNILNIRILQYKLQ